jgi:glycosyltransferase involved in cell wall biosynthesis
MTYPAMPDEATPSAMTRRSDISLLMVATVWSTVNGFLLPYAAHFRNLGWRVDVAVRGTPRDPSMLEAFDHVYELPLSRSMRDVRGLTRGLRALREVLETAPDIVHVHTPIAGFLTRLAVRAMPSELRPAVAYTAHGFHFHEGGHPATNLAFLTAERIAGRWTDRLVVINDDDEAAAIRHRIVPRHRLVRMPGIGLDTMVYAPSTVPLDGPELVRSQIGIVADVPTFVVVGELSRRKRQRDAIAALASMRHLDSHLMFAGDGAQRRPLQRQARELGVEDRVHFLGGINDVRPVVRGAMALILPSDREGLARSVMEALSLEVPVIVSTARGNRELVGTDSGLQYGIGDVRGLARAMDWLIDHQADRQMMGARGRDRMINGYDMKILMPMHESLYGEMLAEKARAIG